jgi:redox-sensitive bicupin YhaK (pirin superfamily)
MSVSEQNWVEHDAPMRISSAVRGVPVTVGTGFKALQFSHRRFPDRAMSPIILVDHFHMWEPTFDVHPHAGFSAVTLAFEDTKGEMLSRDSAGRNTTFGAGDLHWTLAGRGIMHTQIPVDPTAHIHALQIFVNLPARLKSLSPDSFHVAAGDMPEIDGRGLRLRIVAGELSGHKSPAMTPQPILMVDGYITAPHDPIEVPLPPDWNAWLYVVDGGLFTNQGGKLTTGEALCAGVASGRAGLLLGTDFAAHFVMLAGRRVDEPVIHNGPFVFESETSLSRAADAFGSGRFGTVDDTPKQ